MSKTQLPAEARASFEALKQTNEHGAEYWSARKLQPLLGYSQWRRFQQAIERAVTSCETSGNNLANHFAGAGKMVGLGSGSQRRVEDYHLSRFACYLIAQNGDPRKPEIAHAQKYFAIQARRQELSDQAAVDAERLELRKQTATREQARKEVEGELKLKVAARLLTLPATSSPLPARNKSRPSKRSAIRSGARCSMRRIRWTSNATS